MLIVFNDLSFQIFELEVVYQVRWYALSLILLACTHDLIPLGLPQINEHVGIGSIWEVVQAQLAGDIV